MLSVTSKPIMVSVVILNVIMMSVIMVSVVILNVIMLSVVAPSQGRFLAVYLISVGHVLRQ
jgi:hypothetical protein